MQLTSRGVVPRHDLGAVEDVVEGGPARAGLVLGLRAEERLAAHEAGVLAGVVVLVQGGPVGCTLPFVDVKLRVLF